MLGVPRAPLRGKVLKHLLQTRLERATHGLGNRCSIQLSYWSLFKNYITILPCVKCLQAVAQTFFFEHRRIKTQ